MTVLGMASHAASTPPWSLYTERQRWGFLAILFLVSTSNYLDRYVLAVVLEPIKHEFQVADTMLGMLSGFSFAIFYAVFGLPVARGTVFAAGTVVGTLGGGWLARHLGRRDIRWLAWLPAHSGRRRRAGQPAKELTNESRMHRRGRRNSALVLREQ